MTTKLVTKVKKAARNVSRRARKTVRSMADTLLDAKAAAAANMLLDPCNAPLSEACYRGDQGYRTRFVTNINIGAQTGQTCAAIALIPSNNTFATCGAAALGTATTWGVSGGPGTSFLSSTAGALRSLGACVSASPIASNLSTSGQVYATICPVSSLPSNGVNGAAVTISDLLTLCNKYGKITIDQPMETKFIPASADENFTSTNATPSDLSDNNCILMCFVGLPATTGIVCRITNIVEWKPQPFVGIVSESYMGNPSKNTIEHVKQALKAKDPSWWSNVGKGVYSVIRGYATGGTVGAIGAAMRATKFM